MLIVTPGASDAEAYASVAEYKAYCDARGISYSDLTDTQIEQRLRKGADYLTQAYSERWIGYRTSTSQALDWPRVDAEKRGTGGAYYDSATLPPLLVNANIEAAIRASSDLIPDRTQAVKRKKVASLEIEYQDGTLSGPSYPQIEGMLTPLLSAGRGIRLVRA